MTFFGSGWQNSGIEIPEPEADASYYHAKDVPHGHVSEQWYFSTIHQQVAPLLRLHAAGLWDERQRPLPGSVFAPWLGRR
jgi:hypothetical protein